MPSRRGAPMCSVHERGEIGFESDPGTMPKGRELGDCQEAIVAIWPEPLGDDPGDRRAFRVWTCSCRRFWRMSATLVAEAKDSPTSRRYWIAVPAFFSAESRRLRAIRGPDTA